MVRFISGFVAFLILANALSSFPCGALGGAGNNGEKLYPVDEAARNPSFQRFRDSLVLAIEKQDTAFLLGHIYENIALRPTREALRAIYEGSLAKEGSETGEQPHLSWLADYVGPEGDQGFAKAAFQRMWLDGGRFDSLTIWKALGRVVSLGGAFTNDSCTTFHAPYIWAEWPAGTKFQSAIVGSPVYLYYVPSRLSTILDTLSYDLVYGTSLVVGGEPMTKIRTADGVEGYVEHKYVVSPLGLGAEFRLINERWLLTKFTWMP